MSYIFYKIALRWMSLDLIDGKSTLVQVMAWCRQTTSHYLSQCWPRPLSPYGVTRPQWVNELLLESCWGTYYSYGNDDKDNDSIRSQFCTCHDGWAVVICTKLWSDWVVRIQIKARRIFTRFQQWAQTLFVKWFAGPTNEETSNGSWCMGIKGEMSGAVCVTFTWYMYIYELFIAFVCFVVCSLL